MTDLQTKMIINGQKLFPAQIIAIAEFAKLMNIPKWEHDFFDFLKEWFSDSEHILVQTSGSTGKPKQIELPKSFMIKSAQRTIK
ncbi:MAG: long-chain fatty acid--CoA ligase, partial [Bacteroidota bacterium]|nr:long-chain fatty acid--CoA ligase [Bacteroidota bacterium]